MNARVYTREAGDLRRHRAYYDVKVMVYRQYNTKGLCYLRSLLEIKAWMSIYIHRFLCGVIIYTLTRTEVQSNRCRSDGFYESVD